MFLSALQRLWPVLSDRDYGVCSICKKEGDLDREHRATVSYEFGSVFKIYEHSDMDGSVAEERYFCRNCAQSILVDLVEKMDKDHETCWV